MRRCGITVVEVVIVLAIVVILAVTMIPNLGSWFQHYRIKGAVREIVSRMELAKIKALKDNREYRLYMNSDTGTFCLERGNLPNMSSTWDRDGGILSLPHQVSFEEITFSKTESGEDHERAVQFNPHGTAGTGKVVVKNTRNERYTITVSVGTGKINTLRGKH